MRSTPCLLALFSLVTLWASSLALRGLVRPRRAAWYPKAEVTFSDALAAARKELWTAQAFSTSRDARDRATIPKALFDRLADAACHQPERAKLELRAGNPDRLQSVFFIDYIRQPCALGRRPVHGIIGNRRRMVTCSPEFRPGISWVQRLSLRPVTAWFED